MKKLIKNFLLAFLMQPTGSTSKESFSSKLNNDANHPSESHVNDGSG